MTIYRALEPNVFDFCLSFLQAKDWAMADRVCKAWHKRASNDCLWKKTTDPWVIRVFGSIHKILTLPNDKHIPNTNGRMRFDIPTREVVPESNLGDNIASEYITTRMFETQFPITKGCTKAGTHYIVIPFRYKQREQNDMMDYYSFSYGSLSDWVSYEDKKGLVVLHETKEQKNWSYFITDWNIANFKNVTKSDSEQKWLIDLIDGKKCQELPLPLPNQGEISYSDFRLPVFGNSPLI